MPPPGPPPRTSAFAITTLVTGLLGLVPVAVGFGIAALVQVRRRTHTGRNLAIGGMAAALVWVMIGVTFAGGTLLSAFTVERDESGKITGEGKVHLASLRKGDCYTGFAPDAEEIMFVTAVPCTEPHRGEITARLPAKSAAGFGSGSAFDRADLLCQARTAWVTKSRLYDDLQPYLYAPESGGLTGADDKGEGVCAMHYTASGTLSTPLAATMDADRRTHDELRVGDCVADVDTPEPSTATESVELVSCTKPHRYQIFAGFDVPASITGKAPSQSALDEKGQQGCDKRWNAALRDAPEADYEMLWVVPTEVSWYASPKVVCFVGLMDGAPLTKSIVGD